MREAIEESGLAVSESQLVTLSHWTPPSVTPKRFLTWFFVARAPVGKVEIDDGEIRDHAWMRPADALARRDSKQIELRAADGRHAAISSWPSRASRRRSRPRARGPRNAIRRASAKPRVESSRCGTATPATSPATPNAPGARHRLSMLDTGWRYERS